MTDTHVELTAEIRQIIDTLAETKYNEPKAFPGVVAAIKRIRHALEEWGKQGLIISRTNVSEEVREKLYDQEIRPLVERLQEMCIRYGMPVQMVLEWGDDGQCATLTEADRTPCPRLQQVMLAASADGDLDLFMAKIGAIARVVGHNSQVLEQLGIPRNPPDEERQAAEAAGV